MTTAPFPPRSMARRALATLTITYMLSFVDRQILSMLIEPLKHDLELSDVQASLLQGVAFAGIYCIAGIPLGRLGDRFNRRNIILLGVLLWSAMTVCCGLARGFFALFVARAGVGIGEATLSPQAYSLLADYFPARRLTHAMALYGLGPAVGTGFAYIAGGTILASFSGVGMVDVPYIGSVHPWQCAFLIMGAPGILAALLVGRVSEPSRRNEVVAVGPIGVARVASLLFLERRSLGALVAGMSLLSLQGYATMSWMPSMLIRTFGIPVSRIGIDFGAAYMTGSVLGCLGSGWFVAHMPRICGGNRHISWMAVCAATTVILGTVAPLCARPVLIYATCALLFFFQSAWMGAAMSAIYLATANRMRGTLGALVLMCTNILGLTVGPTSVAMITQYVFKDPLALRYSLTLVSASTSLLALLAIAKASRSFPEAGSLFGSPREHVVTSRTAALP